VSERDHYVVRKRATIVRVRRTTGVDLNEGIGVGVKETDYGMSYRNHRGMS